MKKPTIATKVVSALIILTFICTGNAYPLEYKDTLRKPMGGDALNRAVAVADAASPALTSVKLETAELLLHILRIIQYYRYEIIFDVHRWQQVLKVRGEKLQEIQVQEAFNLFEALYVKMLAEQQIGGLGLRTRSGVTEIRKVVKMLRVIISQGGQVSSAESLAVLASDDRNEEQQVRVLLEVDMIDLCYYDVEQVTRFFVMDMQREIRDTRAPIKDFKSWDALGQLLLKISMKGVKKPRIADRILTYRLKRLKEAVQVRRLSATDEAIRTLALTRLTSKETTHDEMVAWLKDALGDRKDISTIANAIIEKRKDTEAFSNLMVLARLRPSQRNRNPYLSQKDVARFAYYLYGLVTQETNQRFDDLMASSMFVGTQL